MSLLQRSLPWLIIRNQSSPAIFSGKLYACFFHCIYCNLYLVYLSDDLFNIFLPLYLLGYTYKKNSKRQNKFISLSHETFILPFPMCHLIHKVWKSSPQCPHSCQWKGWGWEGTGRVVRPFSLKGRSQKLPLSLSLKSNWSKPSHKTTCSWKVGWEM